MSSKKPACAHRPESALASLQQLQHASVRFFRPIILVAVLCVFAGCTEDIEHKPEPSPSDGSSEQTLELQMRAKDARPSVVLIVFDTLRADAVSSYGFVRETTPALDRLSKSGVRYSRAYAPAPWTVASHVSLFSGLRVDQHRIGLAGASVAPESLDLIAEEFRDAGFVTAGFAENALVSTHFGFDQGFDDFESQDIVKVRRAFNLGEKKPEEFDVVEQVRRWNLKRDKAAPYFLFINLFDPHDPYVARDVNRWIPEDVTKEEANFIQARYSIPDALCDGLPIKEHLDVLRGLYLGDVAAADRKLEEILDVLDAGEDAGTRLVVATSDHGEHFGENRLMGHQFSVRNPTLHVPLIVSGLPETHSIVIDEPVELRQVHQSLLCWALDTSCPAPLRTVADSGPLESEPDAPIFSIYSDSVSRLPRWLVEQFGDPSSKGRVDPARLKCESNDRVFGDMVSMIQYPMKITWFSQGDPVLHDLSWDPEERFDQMKHQPAVASALREVLESFVDANVLGSGTPDTPELTEEGVRALKSLGYIR
jgi:hypothetical protein